MRVRRCELVLILLMAVASPPDSLDPGGWVFSQRAVFAAEALCTPGGDSWVGAGDRLMELSETLALESGRIGASLTVTARDADSSEIFLRSGGVEAGWPGTPWIGAGVSRSLRAPFVPGLRDPLIEHGWVDIDSVSSIHGRLGGLLGTTLDFTEHFLPGADTICVFEASSPWLGFGSFGYTRIWSAGADSAFDLDTYEARVDLRMIEPWIVLARSGSGADSTALVVEGAGYSPLGWGGGRLELVPVFTWAGDSIEVPGKAFPPGRTTVGLDAVVRPLTSALSGMAGCRYDPADPGAARGRASVDLVSEGGFHHSLLATGIGGRSWQCSLESVLHAGRTSMGGGLELMQDSVRITGTAGYSPLPGVHALLDISASPEAGGGALPQPACSLGVAYCRQGARALIVLERSGGVTTVGASLCAVFP